MHWLYIVFIAFIFFATLAMLIREGLWSNLLTLVNVVFSGILAFSLFGPLAIWLDEMLDGEFTYFLDFVSLWAVFSVSMIILRLCTDSLSRTRIRFKLPVESIGSPLVAFLVAWIVIGMVASIFHTAPLPKGFLGNAIVVSEQAEVEMSPLRPHLHWLRFAGNAIMMLGSEDVVNELQSDDGPLETFAAKTEYQPFVKTAKNYADLWARIFVVKYQIRRSIFGQNADGLRVKRS